jgi:hypothetical protein
LTDKWEEALRGRPETKVTPLSPGAAAPPIAEKGDYQPWGREHANIDDVIEVRLKSGEWRQVFRPYLVAVEGVGDTTLSLLCTSYAVTLEGRHLAELRHLIKARAVDFIQEFDPSQWREPGEGAPRIERMEIVQAKATRSVPEQSARR